MDQGPGHRRQRKRFVGCYRDPEGRTRSAGTYSSKRAAERAANREEAKVREGAWHDHSRGQVTFTDYVQTAWLPSKQVETSTLAACRSYLDKHFSPVFGRRPMGNILPSEIQRIEAATLRGFAASPTILIEGTRPVRPNGHRFLGRLPSPPNTRRALWRAGSA